jgi:hypothetical protein
MISALFNCMRVVWHFTCFVWNYIQVTVISNEWGNINWKVLATNRMGKLSLPMVNILNNWKVVATNSMEKSSLPMVRIIVNGKVVATHGKDINKLGSRCCPCQ